MYDEDKHDHRIEISAKITNREKIDGKLVSKHVEFEMIAPCSYEINTYAMTSQLYCTLLYYMQNINTPICITLGKLLHITSTVTAEPSESNIITTPNLFNFDKNIKSMRKFIKQLIDGKSASFEPTINHKHYISYDAEKNIWTHKHGDVTIQLLLTDVSVEKFKHKFNELLKIIDGFYVEHCTALQRDYIAHMDLISDPVIVVPSSTPSGKPPFSSASSGER